MAWYLNHYCCGDCEETWDDEWSCCCDEECPHCGSRNWSPMESDDLTYVVVREEGGFTLYFSPDSAEHHPDYQTIGTFPTMSLANATRDALNGNVDFV